MHPGGVLTLYSLTDVSEPGTRPQEKLVYLMEAYYSERIVGYSRVYAAMSANQRIDKVVRCTKTEIPIAAEYAVLEDGEQYRITLKQQRDADADLTLVKVETKLDVLDADQTE